MPNHISTGKLGEDTACDYLKKIGYKILARNYREKYGEIDIVCRETNGTLVFAEVKTLKNNFVYQSDFSPEDNASSAKLRKLRKICEMFANKHPELVNTGRGWRIDLIAIRLDEGGDLNIKHYENI